MYKKSFLAVIILILFTAFSSELKAQDNSIIFKGKIVDTFTYEQVAGTTISILNAADSTLVSFTRCNEEGDFAVKVDKAGNYLILYAQKYFASFIDEKTIPSEGLDVGEVYMFPKSTLLKEVVILESRAITIKGDTIEYNADSFKVREFDNVEELLKKLPGIEVDAKGNITAHGEKVQKMLVDGDEFFSDDPVVLSKMLKASAVQSVQVFDDKSEQAKFTGIDDGTKEKTINLQLRDEAKTGYFGKIEAGAGLPEYYENSAILNYFKDKKKFSVYGVLSNTNKTGLGWEDMQNIGSSSMMFTEDGGMSITTSSDDFSDFNGRYNGNGLPKTQNIGTHYSNKVGSKNQHEINAGYRLNNNSFTNTNENYTDYFFVDTSYTNTSITETSSNQLTHNVNGRYNWIIDSTSNLNVKAGGQLGNNTRNEETNSNNAVGSDIINKNFSNTKTNSESTNGNVDITYRKKLNTHGRSLSIQGIMNSDQRTGESNFKSNTEYLAIGSSYNYDQEKEFKSDQLNLKGALTYTEPIIKDKLSLISNASYTVNNRKSENYTYDVVGEERVLSDSFTNVFDYKVNIASVGTSISWMSDKYIFTAGTNVSYSEFNQTNVILDSTLNFDYFNLNPRISFRNKNSRNINYSLNYNGNTKQPEVHQLQPVFQNSDPLNIRIGNMDLRQEFRHNFSGNISQYKTLQQKYLYSYFNVNYTKNAISTDQVLRENGVREYTYYNSKGNLNLWLYAGYSFKPKNWEPRLSVNLSANYSNYRNRLNYIESMNSNTSFTPSFRIDWSKDTTIMLVYDVSASYNITNSNNTSITNNNFLSTTQNLNASYDLGKGFIIGTDINWILREKVSEFDNNNNVLLINAYLSKSFLKDKSLVIKLYGNDLLNQNIGFNRFVNNNMISETYNNTIKRYGMLSIAWNFTKMKAISQDGTLQVDDSLEKEAETDPEAYITK